MPISAESILDRIRREMNAPVFRDDEVSRLLKALNDAVATLTHTDKE